MTHEDKDKAVGLLRAVPEGATTSLRLGNWSTNSYAPEADVKDDDDDTAGLSVLE